MYQPPEGLSTKQKPLPPSLLGLPFLHESMLAARKQGRCAEKASAGKGFRPEILPGFRIMGRAQRAPGRAPLQRNRPGLLERTACPPCTMLGKGPPDPRNEERLMVFSRNALVSGPGMA